VVTAQQIVDKLLEAEVNPADLWKQTVDAEWDVKYTGYRKNWLLLHRGKTIATFREEDIDPQHLLSRVRKISEEHPCPPNDVIAWMMRYGLTNSNGDWLG